jgi:hypothetical protein
MQTYLSLWHVTTRTGGPAGSARRRPSTGSVRARAKRGVLVLALLLGSLFVAAAVSSAHGSAGHVHVSAALSVSVGSVGSYSNGANPWMY